MGLVSPRSLKSLLAGLFIGLATQALAQDPERFVIRDWVVLRDTDADGQSRCVAGVGQDGGDIRLLFAPDGALLFRISIKAMSLPPGLYTIALQVDDTPPWTFHDTRGEGSVLFVPLPNDTNGQEILREILDGRVLKIHDNLGLPVIGFSLLGSGAALQKMLECAG